MSDYSFNRAIAGIIDTASAMQGLVKERGSLSVALKGNHGTVLASQMFELNSLCRLVDRLMKENKPNGSYSVTSEPSNPSPIPREDTE